MNTPTGYAPTTKAALALFLIGGPLLYWPVLLIFEGDFAHIPLMSLGGAVAWSIMALVPSGWFVTWIPTAAAAIILAYALRLLAARSWYTRATKAVKLMLAGAISAIISEICYEPGYALANAIHPGPTPTLQEAAQNAAINRAAEDLSPFPAGAHFVSGWHLAPVVIVTGAILGVILAWIATNANRRFADPDK
jgi:hypothetical protein